MMSRHSCPYFAVLSMSSLPRSIIVAVCGYPLCVYSVGSCPLWASLIGSRLLHCLQASTLYDSLSFFPLRVLGLGQLLISTSFCTSIFRRCSLKKLHSFLPSCFPRAYPILHWLKPTKQSSFGTALEAAEVTMCRLSF